MTSTPSRVPKPAAFQAALAVCAVAAVALVASSPTIADEAFVCGDGSVVNVKSGQLEIVKRTNPCVARYFGLDVATNDHETAKAIALGATALLRRDGAEVMKLPARNPTRDPGGSATADEARSNGGNDIAAKVPAARQANPIETGSTRRAPAHSEQPPTDYRNVRIINAGPGSSPWFHHNR